ncbi:rhodanese-like domain-containing protein [Spongorhabdus nitratireducens]
MRFFRKIIFAITLLLPTLPMASSNTVNAPAISDGKPLLLDVRTPEEFNAGHYPGAINLDFRLVPRQLGSMVSDKHQPVLMYCRSGRRASIAKRQLEAMGYTDIRNLGGLHEVVALCRQAETGENCSAEELEKLSRNQ